MKRYHARKAVIKALTEKGLYIETTDNPMKLQVCSKSGDIIEPILKPQWWVNCTPLAEAAVEVSGLRICDSRVLHSCRRLKMRPNLLSCSVHEQASCRSARPPQRANGTAGSRRRRTGAFRASCGGVTEFLRTLSTSKGRHQMTRTMHPGLSHARRKRRRRRPPSASRARSTRSGRMRTFWTRGSHLACGPSLPLAGQSK